MKKAFKKIMAMGLATLLFLCSVPLVLHAEETFVPQNYLTGNVDFETESGSTISGWNTDQVADWDLECSVEHARKGAQSLLVTIPKEKAAEKVVTMLYKGKTEALEPDTNYVMSAWVRTVEPLEYDGRPPENYGVQVYARVTGTEGTKYNVSPMIQDTKGEWQKVERVFKLQSTEDQIRFYLRFTEKIYGSIYIDDVQVNLAEDVPKDEAKTEKDRGRLISDEPKPDPSLVPVPEGSLNLFTNGSFEEVGSDGAPAGEWASYGSKWNELVKITDGGYDGQKCVSLTDPGRDNPWIYKEDMRVISGAEYQVSLWLKTESVKETGPRLKFEFYDDNGASIMAFQSELLGKTYGAWHQKSARFFAPTGATVAKIYFRLYGTGQIYYDDLQCHMISEASRIQFDGDTFFYTEWEKGTVGASINESFYTATGTEVFDIALKDGETVLKQRTGVPAKAEAILQFDVMMMSEIGKEYAIEATLYASEGGEKLETAKWNIYRFDRPKMMNENGEFVVNGEVITPIWGYHVYVADQNMKYGKAAGVNIAQGGGGNVENLLQYLDSAHANGMMASLVLYGGTAMLTAGDPTKIENTIAVAKAVKDHPALFGYIIMDEPYLHLTNPYPDLVRAYREIRKIDSVHPIIIQETAATNSAKYTTACSDLLLIHDYSCNVTVIDHPDYGMQAPTKNIAKMERLRENTHVRKKDIHFLGQTFGEPTKEDTQTNKYYLPSIDEAKSMIYQALIENMTGVGYYCFQSTGWHLTETPLYEPLCKFAEEELFTLTDAFIMNKGTFFNEDRTQDVWWHTFSMDNALYAIALNMKDEVRNVEIPLESINGAVKIDAYTASLEGGTNLPETVKGNGILSLEVVPHAAALYKITPDTPVDFSVMEKSFDDMENHDWALEAVEYLYEKEVVNTTGIRQFSPGEKITRADFAMFLIRALNITGDTSGGFADVDDTAYYAKEIAIGKAAGILKGVGEDSYNPNAEITRQDMMVIVQRGLAYVNAEYEKGEGTELDAFSDNALIAEYATEALSSMVKSGIILGNADGTVNPLGNASRAEAAMVMYRIMQ